METEEGQSKQSIQKDVNMLNEKIGCNGKIRKFKTFQPSKYIPQESATKSFIKTDQYMSNEKNIQMDEISNLSDLVKNKLKTTVVSTGQNSKRTFLLPKLQQPNRSDSCLPTDSNGKFLIPLLDKFTQASRVTDVCNSVKDLSIKENEAPKAIICQQEVKKPAIDLMSALQDKVSSAEAAAISLHCRQARLKASQEKVAVVQEWDVIQNIKDTYREEFATNRQPISSKPSSLAQVLFCSDQEIPKKRIRFELLKKSGEINCKVIRFNFETKSPDDIILEKMNRAKTYMHK